MKKPKYKEKRKIFLSTPQEKTYTLLGMNLLAIFVVLLVVVRPTVLSIAKVRSEIEVLKDIKEEAEHKLTVISQLDAQYKQDISPYLPVLTDTFPDDLNFSAIQNTLGIVAHDTGFDVLSVSITNNNGGDTDYVFLNKFMINVSVKGDVRDLYNLLVALEGLPNSPSIQFVNINDLKGNIGIVNIGLMIFTVNDNINFEL